MKSEVDFVVTSRDQGLHLTDSDRRFLLCLAVPTAGGWGKTVGEEEDAAADPVSLTGCGVVVAKDFYTGVSGVGNAG